MLLCFGARQDYDTWRKMYSYELYEAFNEPAIVHYVKVDRLAWAGHFIFMNNDRILEKENPSPNRMV